MPYPPAYQKVIGCVVNVHGPIYFSGCFGFPRPSSFAQFFSLFCVLSDETDSRHRPGVFAVLRNICESQHSDGAAGMVRLVSYLFCVEISVRVETIPVSLVDVFQRLTRRPVLVFSCF